MVSQSGLTTTQNSPSLLLFTYLIARLSRGSLSPLFFRSRLLCRFIQFVSLFLYSFSLLFLLISRSFS